MTKSVYASISSVRTDVFPLAKAFPFALILLKGVQMEGVVPGAEMTSPLQKGFLYEEGEWVISAYISSSFARPTTRPVARVSRAGAGRQSLGGHGASPVGSAPVSRGRPAGTIVGLL